MSMYYMNYADEMFCESMILLTVHLVRFHYGCPNHYIILEKITIFHLSSKSIEYRCNIMEFSEKRMILN